MRELWSRVTLLKAKPYSHNNQNKKRWKHGSNSKAPPLQHKALISIPHTAKEKNRVCGYSILFFDFQIFYFNSTIVLSGILHDLNPYTKHWELSYCPLYGLPYTKVPSRSYGNQVKD
jgi:hypothetical protein